MTAMIPNSDRTVSIVFARSSSNSRLRSLKWRKISTSPAFSEPAISGSVGSCDCEGPLPEDPVRAGIAVETTSGFGPVVCEVAFSEELVWTTAVGEAVGDTVDCKA